MGNNYNFPDIHYGNTFKQRNVTLLSSSTPIDLTGSNVCMQLKKGYGDATAVHEFSTTIIDPLNGVIQLNQWQVNAPPRDYIYDLVITFQSGIVLTVLKGCFNILNTVSKC